MESNPASDLLKYKAFQNFFIHTQYSETQVFHKPKLYYSWSYAVTRGFEISLELQPSQKAASRRQFRKAAVLKKLISKLNLFTHSVYIQILERCSIEHAVLEKAHFVKSWGLHKSLY